MEPIKITEEKDLPKLIDGKSEKVIVWGTIGHKPMTPQIATLHNLNGVTYREYSDNLGKIYKSPNLPYPDKYEWNISGTWYKLSEITHWCKLPIIS
jgi:hypothetical protein